MSALVERWIFKYILNELETLLSGTAEVCGLIFYCNINIEQLLSSIRILLSLGTGSFVLLMDTMSNSVIFMYIVICVLIYVKYSRKSLKITQSSVCQRSCELAKVWSILRLPVQSREGRTALWTTQCRLSCQSDKTSQEILNSPMKSGILWPWERSHISPSIMVTFSIWAMFRRT